MLTNFKSVFEKAKKIGEKKIAIAGAEGKAVLEAVRMARENGIMEPFLVGDSKKIEKIAEEIGLDLNGVTIFNEIEENLEAEKAVELVHTDVADGLMKGKVSTPVLLKAVLNKKYNLRMGTLLSHAALLELSGYPKFLMVTDGGMVIQPTLEQKVGILKNGIHLMQKLGVQNPKVAVLAAIENVTPEMPETEHAAKLVEMAERGEFGKAVVEGPIAFDVAYSPEAARIKGINSRISGEPDILLMPNIVCGNIFAKGLIHIAKAKIGGLIVGARKPIILLSRSDDAETRFNSIALGVITS